MALANPSVTPSLSMHVMCALFQTAKRQCTHLNSDEGNAPHVDPEDARFIQCCHNIFGAFPVSRPR